MLTLKRYKFSLLTFGIAFIIMTMVFAKMKMYPFGQNQIMIIDSWHQYFPIFKELNSKLRNFDSLFYSWNTGAGTNFLTMIGYYGMSPINLLSILVPDSLLREFFMFATILKIALGGMFFSIYINKLYKRDDLSITIFGLFYSFSGFMICYYWNIMWLDVVALLPLIILGLHKLVVEEKYLLYVISLSIALISNFYIAFFVCEFIAIYYFAIYFTTFRNRGVNHLWFKTVKIALYSLLSIGLAAITLVPIIYGMSLAYGQASGNPDKFETYYSLMDIFNNLFIYVKPTIVDGLPNIYSGMLPLLLMPLYFMIKSVPLRAKIINSCLLILMFVSLNVNYLNFIWHGLHFPNQVPFRFSFIITFLILTISYEVITNIEDVSFKNLGYVIAGYFVYMLINERTSTELFEPKIFYITFGILMVYTFLFVLYKKKIITFERLLVIIYVFVLLESYFNSVHIATAAGSSGRSAYYVQDNEVQSSLRYLEENDSDFWRTEIFSRYSVNDPLLYGYRGISQFASTANSKFGKFTQEIGLPSDAGSNTMTYVPNTPALNGMLGIKYILSKHTSLADPNIAYEKIHEEKDLSVYQNKFYLPLGYRVSTAINELDLTRISPFERQESFYQLATGKAEKVFSNIPVSKEKYTNMEVTEYEGIRFHYKNIDKNSIGKAKITYKALETKQLYVYMLNQTRTMTLTYRDGSSSVHETPRGIMIDLGIVQKDVEFDIEFEVPAAETGFFDIGVATFDDQKFQSLITSLQEETLEVTEFDDTYIKGTITVTEPGLIYTSIPYEKGWHVKIDGDRVDTIAYKDAVITIPVTAGTHDIEFEYTPAGLIIGSVISFISLIILVLNRHLLKIVSKNNRNNLSK